MRNGKPRFETNYWEEFIKGYVCSIHANAKVLNLDPGENVEVTAEELILTLFGTEPRKCMSGSDGQMLISAMVL